MKQYSGNKLAYETKYLGEHPEWHLAGVDEAGRGPLVGPVVAAAVSMPLALAQTLAIGDLAGLNDSKQLSENKRELFFHTLTNTPGIDFGVGIVSAQEIDKINILNATHLAMRRAILSLKSPADFALVDGLRVKGLPCEHEAIVKGDAKSFFIAAASVIAKVTRDHSLVELDKKFPEYGFAKHKGYGTAEHLEALRKFGPCPEHRRTFKPVAELDQMLLF